MIRESFTQERGPSRASDAALSTARRTPVVSRIGEACVRAMLLVLPVVSTGCWDERYRIEKCITPASFFERYGPIAVRLGGSDPEAVALPREVDTVRVQTRAECPSVAMDVAEDASSSVFEKYSSYNDCSTFVSEWSVGVAVADHAYYRESDSNTRFGGVVVRGYRRVGDDVSDLLLFSYFDVDRESGSIARIRVYLDYKQTRDVLCGP